LNPDDAREFLFLLKGGDKMAFSARIVALQLAA